jgi:Polysaccharide biosynthesis enzyme WcbI
VTKVCILGNCQAQHLEAMLATSSPDVQVTRLEPVFMMNEAHHGPVYEALAAADIVFAQRISDEFKMDWLSSAEIRKSFGGKVVVWPNIYFDGYFPGVSYVYHGGWGKLLSPLVEYHFTQVMAAHRAGHSIEAAIDAFAGEGLLATTPDPFGQSLAQLRAREADTDVIISDFIAEQATQQRLFYTPNHPMNALLGEMLRRMAAKTGLEVDIAEGIAMPYRLDDVYIASSPAVVRRYGLGFDHEAGYRGRQILSVQDNSVTFGDPCSYDVRQLVEAYYRLYDQVFAPAG